jgi:hypothetical protein
MQILAIVLEVAVKRRDINPSSINSGGNRSRNKNLEMRCIV